MCGFAVANIATGNRLYMDELMRFTQINDLNSAQHVSNIMLLWVDSAFWKENSDKVIDRIKEALLQGQMLSVWAATMCSSCFGRIITASQAIWLRAYTICLQRCMVSNAILLLAQV